MMVHFSVPPKHIQNKNQLHQLTCKGLYAQKTISLLHATLSELF